MRTRRRGGAPKRVTLKEILDILGDDSDKASSSASPHRSESDSEPEIICPEFIEYVNKLVARFGTATHVPPIFAPLVRRLSNVVIMCLATGRIHGKDRNILFIGEFHSENFRRKHGFTPISELIVPYLREANYVDFMFETSVREVNDFAAQKFSRMTYDDMHRYQRQLEEPKNTTGIDILNQLRQLLCWYIPTEGHPARGKFPKAKVHYIDLAYPLGHKKSNNLLHVLNDVVELNRDSDTRKPRFAQLKRKIQSQLIELSRDTDSPLTDAIFRDAFNMSLAFEDREYALRLIFDCAFEELRRLVLKNCYAQERNIETKYYSSMFLASCEMDNYSDYDFFFKLHRFLMDIYTCCRILKSDSNERWYKNMVVYAGAFHTVNCIRLMELYGFTLKTVDFMNAETDPAIPVPPFKPGAIYAGEFRREGEEHPSSAVKGYLDSKGRFFEGPAPAFYEID